MPAVRNESTSTAHEIEAVYVWDLIVRATHWAIVFSFIVLAVTGIDLGRPFLGGVTTNVVKIVHYYAAIVFSLAVFSRIVWMFLGPSQSSWRQFLPVNPRRRRDFIGTAKFYLMLSAKPPAATGHNPLAGFTYIAVFTLYLVMILSGFALYSTSAYTSYMSMWHFLVPLFGGAQGARWVHHVVMWLLIGFSVHHLFSAMLMSKVEKNGVFDSIITGWKFLPKDRKGDDE